MGRVIFVGASTLMAFIVFGCGGSTAGNNTTGSGGSAGAGVPPGTASIAFTVVGGPYCMTETCGAGPSIDIKDSAGKSLTLTTSCSDLSCGTCMRSPCPGIACAIRGIKVTGASLDWDGSSYVTSTCGTGTACTGPAFAPPGKYTATFCATPGKLTGPDGGFQQQCVTNGSPKCASVEFDLPSSVVVKGAVGP